MIVENYPNKCRSLYETRRARKSTKDLTELYSGIRTIFAKFILLQVKRIRPL